MSESPSSFASVTAACRRFFQEHGWAGHRLLVGVSGGADSVALLRVLLTIREEFQLDICVGHFDHGWRADSAADARWVVELCGRLGVPCQTGRAAVDATPASSKHATAEGIARDLRYEFFGQAAQESDCRLLAVGHTEDDQVETVLHHILRGTGLKGLAGIPATRRVHESLTLIRPLLCLRHEEIVAELQAAGQEFLQDPSNDSMRYTRNRIRADLLPRLREEYNPRFDEALLRLAAQAADAQAALEQQAALLCAELLLETQPDGLRLMRVPLGSQSPAVVRELFRGLWQRQGWPRQALNSFHLEQMTVQAQTGSPVQLSLPDGLVSLCRNEVLEIRRIPVSEPIPGQSDRQSS